MTPEEFNHFIKNSNPEEFTQAFSKYTEKERKVLSTTVSKQVTEARRIYNDYDLREKTYKQQGEKTFVKYYRMCQLAVLALCPWTHAKIIKLKDFHYLWGPEILNICSFEKLKGKTLLCDYAVQIILDRKPEWLGKWLEEQFNSEDYGEIRWNNIDALIKTNLLPRPSSQRYVEFLLDYFFLQSILRKILNTWILMPGIFSTMSRLRLI